MLDALTTALPGGAVLTDPDVIESYRHDWARDPNAGIPLAVVRATRTEDVQAVLRWASAHQVPVVPRGAGSGLSGGATAVDGGLVLSLEKMRTVEIDPAMRVAVAQPGALNVEVKKAAAEQGLWYPPIRRRSRCARSAVTRRPIPAGWAVSSTASPRTTSWSCSSCSRMGRLCGSAARGSRASPVCRSPSCSWAVRAP